MPAKTVTIDGAAGAVRIARDRHGVVHIAAETLDDAHLGLGWAHARDRGLQMLVVRVLARGQACEKLRDTPELLEIDQLFRRMNFAAHSRDEAKRLTPLAAAGVDAYCRGVGLYFERHKIPWELRVAGYRMKGDPWTAADTILTARTVGYIALAQTQGDLESFLLECVQAGIARDKLEELFPGKLDGLDDDLIRRVRLTQRLVPESLRWNVALPKPAASNNWAVAGTRTASGRAMLCNDPHLEINRLPTVWYEAVLRWSHDGRPRYALGATMPGVPGVIVGRTPELAWGVTYAFMDCIDSWIEDCRDGKHRVGDEWRPFTTRTETIARKRHAPEVITFYENHHGTLDGDPRQPGLYLATRWTGASDVAVDSFDAAMRVLTAATVAEAMPLFARICTSSYHWVLADRAGNIGYQMSGRAPIRREGASGLVPLPGWEPGHDWRGFVNPADLPSSFNPPEGFVATANDDLNHLGRAHPINACMGPYRGQRIREVLRDARNLTPQEMRRLQFDLLSPQAQQFVAIARPLLARAAMPDAARRALADWDCRYDDDSPAPLLFERFYTALLEEVFGPQFGREVLRHLRRTAVMAVFFWQFDRILLAEHSAWFGARRRDEIYLAALARAGSHPLTPFGRTRRFFLRHLLLGKKVPRFLGLDRGPYILRGSRATVHQGQLLRRHGTREVAVNPSFRMIADLGDDELLTTCPGGPSDRPFSRWYNNGTADWIAGNFKTLVGLDRQPESA